MITLNDIAKKFLSTDTNRHKIMDFNHDGDYVIATNAHVLLKAPSDYFDLDGITHKDDYPDYKSIMPVATKDVVAKIPIAEFNEKFDKFKQPIYGEIECDRCNGMGGEHCNLDHWHECESCNGAGSIKTRTIIGYAVSINDFVVDINGVLFSPNHIKLVCEFCEHIGLDHIHFSFLQPKGRCLIYIDNMDISILIMALLEDSSFRGAYWRFPQKEKASL